jgi:hypothetical protein
MKKKYETRIIPLHRVFLDNENPRHDPIEAEPEIINYLIAEEQVRPLAASIAKMGTSPLERMGVIPHPTVENAWITAEGNRRLCALKLLNDPERAPDRARGYFRELAQSMGSRPDDIEAVVFKDRQQSRPFVELRHEGPQGGVGTRGWDPRQKARHNAAGENPTNPNLLAIALLDYAEKRGLITKKEHERINFTTITRFLSNPVFRDAIGLSSPREFKIHSPQPEFDVALERFLKDSLNGDKTGVNSRTDAKQRADYAHKLRKEGVSVSTRLASPKQVDPGSGRTSAVNPSSRSERARRQSRSPDKRLTVIPTEFVAHPSNKVLKRLYDELRGVDCHLYPFAAAYLVRAVIEQLVTLFCKQRKLRLDGDLHILVGRAAEELAKENAGTLHQLKPLRVMASDKDDRSSPDTLGAFVHGGMIPTGAQLNRFWDSVEFNMRLLFDRVK